MNARGSVISLAGGFWSLHNIPLRARNMYIDLKLVFSACTIFFFWRTPVKVRSNLKFMKHKIKVFCEALPRVLIFIYNWIMDISHVGVLLNSQLNNSVSLCKNAIWLCPIQYQSTTTIYCISQCIHVHVRWPPIFEAKK